MSLRDLSWPLVFLLALVVLSPISGSAQTTVTRDPQAVALADQSLQALTGGTTVNDIALQGSATYTAGSDIETGAVTLLAGGNLASRLTLNLSGGQRTEIRNGPAGDWIGTDGAEHAMALHNCWPDAAWFYPGLSFEALSTDPNLGLAYVGLESKNGLSVQHIRLFRVLSGSTTDFTTQIANLSAEDVYLDAASSLPLFLDFNVHPDTDAGTNIPVEIQFANYQPVSGIQVPFHIQKYLQFSLLLDLNLTSVTVNSGIPQTEFAVQ